MWKSQRVSYYNENDGSSEDEYYLINIDSNGKISKHIKLLPDLEDGSSEKQSNIDVNYIINYSQPNIVNSHSKYQK